MGQLPEVWDGMPVSEGARYVPNTNLWGGYSQVQAEGFQDVAWLIVELCQCVGGKDALHKGGAFGMRNFRMQTT